MSLQFLLFVVLNTFSRTVDISNVILSCKEFCLGLIYLKLVFRAAVMSLDGIRQFGTIS